jgi:hypothetical protein
VAATAGVYAVPGFSGHAAVEPDSLHDGERRAAMLCGVVNSSGEGQKKVSAA